MQVWHSSSSSSEPCVMCGKKTAHYKVYEQSNMELRIPLCDSGGRPTCSSVIDVEKVARRVLIDVKKAIKQQKGEENK